MKILIISNMYPSSEKPYSGVFVLNQYNYIRRISGLSVRLFAMKRTFTSMLGSVYKYLKAGLRFIPHLFKGYDILHVHFFYPLVILAVLYKLFYPRVIIFVTFHGSDINKWMNGRLSKMLFKAILRRIDTVISVGRDLAMTIEKKLGRKCDIILSAGVDESVFFNAMHLEKRYDFIFVGSFIRRKGIDILINAIRLINDKNIRYCFVGSGPYRDQVVKLKSEFNVTLKESQTQQQLRELYNQSRYFVLPSRDEPFGLVATEALFCGAPILVSANGGLKDQVSDGVNGFIIKSDRAEDYAEKMNMLVTLPFNEYRLLVDAALKSNKQHSLRHVCQTLIELYKKALLTDTNKTSNLDFF